MAHEAKIFPFRLNFTEVKSLPSIGHEIKFSEDNLAHDAEFVTMWSNSIKMHCTFNFFIYICALEEVENKQLMIYKMNNRRTMKAT